ncbi:uncharacterized protein LOC109703762, partial [Ananas comosus]|uniref:Uncharacterized protein LOC109703762 n=1 Tax=Ananas comosus TaxID=4615 RepID=A0A6P5EA67_ANACO
TAQNKLAGQGSWDPAAGGSAAGAPAAGRCGRWGKVATHTKCRQEAAERASGDALARTGGGRPGHGFSDDSDLGGTPINGEGPPGSQGGEGRRRATAAGARGSGVAAGARLSLTIAEAVPKACGSGGDRAGRKRRYRRAARVVTSATLSGGGAEVGLRAQLGPSSPREPVGRLRRGSSAR